MRLLVTVFAFEALEFILYNSFICYNNWFMAGVTGYFGMFTLQTERCFVVIKPRYFPVFFAVAAFAVGLAFLLKLPVVVVFMAVATAIVQPTELTVGVNDIW